MLAKSQFRLCVLISESRPDGPVPYQPLEAQGVTFRQRQTVFLNTIMGITVKALKFH
jgi:hypothetical protein